MCVILFKKIGCPRIKEEYLETSWKSNNDSAGLAVALNGELIVQNFLKYSEFREALEPYMDMDIPTLIHFRAASNMTTANDIRCAHPFKISDTSCFAHNGNFSTLSKHPNSHKQQSFLSDTHNFNELIAKDMNSVYPDWWLNPGLFWLLENTVGKTNRVVFLNNNGDYRIVNEEEGIWEPDGDLWFSNNMYKVLRPSVADCEYSIYSHHHSQHHKFGSTSTVKTYPVTTPTKTQSQYPPLINHHTNNTNNNPNNPNTNYTSDISSASMDEAISLKDLAAVDEYLERMNAGIMGKCGGGVSDDPLVTKISQIAVEPPKSKNIEIASTTESEILQTEKNTQPDVISMDSVVNAETEISKSPIIPAEEVGKILLGEGKENGAINGNN